MTGERREAVDLITKWITTGWQKGNTDLLDNLMSAEFIDHDSAGRSSDLKGFKEGISRLYSAFPDFYASVEDILFDKGSDKAAVRWSGKGTHKAEYLGYPPTHKVINFKGIEILSIKEKLITHRWGEWDGIDLIQQLKT